MFGKKSPLLTASYCNAFENLRLAVEVFTGHRPRFVHIDFNTGCGKVRLGEEEKNVWFTIDGNDRLQFELSGNEGWCVALFSEGDHVKIGSPFSLNAHIRETIAGTFTMRWVGTSLVDRREEPLFPEHAEYSAQAHGLTIEELLAGEPAKKKPC